MALSNRNSLWERSYDGKRKEYRLSLPSTSRKNVGGRVGASEHCVAGNGVLIKANEYAVMPSVLIYQAHVEIHVEQVFR